MAIDKALLSILCCPVTKQPVTLLTSSQLKALNKKISGGNVKTLDETPITETTKGALVTENGEHIYLMDDDIPVMLEEKSLPGSLIANE